MSLQWDGSRRRGHGLRTLPALALSSGGTGEAAGDSARPGRGKTLTWAFSSDILSNHTCTQPASPVGHPPGHTHAHSLAHQYTHGHCKENHVPCARAETLPPRTKPLFRCVQPSATCTHF